jgi:hypothetical protein
MANAGWFSKGNKAARGHGRRTVEERYLGLPARAIPPEKLEGVLRAVADKAIGGDLKAAEIVIRLTYGTDPVLTRKLAADLAAELKRVRSGQPADGSEPAAGGGAPGNVAGQPAAGGAAPRPVAGPDAGEPGAGPVADERAVLPLFADVNVGI